MNREGLQEGEFVLERGTTKREQGLSGDDDYDKGTDKREKLLHCPRWGWISHWIKHSEHGACLKEVSVRL
jgi:hypothetical protein